MKEDIDMEAAMKILIISDTHRKNENYIKILNGCRK